MMFEDMKISDLRKLHEQHRHNNPTDQTPQEILDSLGNKKEERQNVKPDN